MKIILTAIGSKYIHTALGLRSIRAYAKAHGIEAELIEDTVQTPLLAVLAEITGKEPDVVGLSVHIWNKNYVYSLIRLLRKVMPQLKIIAGGPEVSFEPERIFNECPQIDYIVMGEGEEVFVSLINALQQNSEPPAHVAFKKDGRVIISGGTAVVADLDVLEFAYPDLTDVVAGKKIVYDILLNARNYLKEDGTLYLVIRKEQGAKSAIIELKKYYDVSIVNKSKGFYIIVAKMC